MRAGVEASVVQVIGASALVERYTLALASAAMLARRADDDAAAHGLWRIAHRAGIV
jgi:2-keto-3-deoxy-galactonokinase